MIFENVTFGTEFDKTKLPKCWSEKRKDDFGKLEKMFEAVVKNALEELNIGTGSIKCQTPNGSSQYSQCVFWYKLAFCKEAINNLQEDYKDVRGIHIMPYTITEEDIKKAVKKDLIKFCCAENDYIDFDGGSGNFHKFASPKTVRYQVVLIRKGNKDSAENPQMAGGPGWGMERKEEQVESYTIGGSKRFVKIGWYFPTIQAEESLLKNRSETSAEELLKNDLKNNLDKAFKTIFNKAYYETIKP